MSDTPAPPTREREIADLIRRADAHTLGRAFLLHGAQGAVAATFHVHAFLVDAARDHLARDEHKSRPSG